MSDSDDGSMDGFGCDGGDFLDLMDECDEALENTTVQGAQLLPRVLHTPVNR